MQIQVKLTFAFSEAFGERDSVDAAEDLAKRLGYVQPESAYGDVQQNGLVNVSDIHNDTVRKILTQPRIAPKYPLWSIEQKPPYPKSSVNPYDDN